MSRSVKECQGILNNDDFDDWVLFYKEYPPLNHHLSHMLSSLIATTWNAHGGKRTTLKPKDLVPDYGRSLMTQEDKAREAVEKMRRR